MTYCLVVEDSRVIRKIACRILEELRIEADEAEDGATALDSCRARMPDLILLDGNMPDMRGVEIVRQIRIAKDGAKPLIVYCTTENDVDHITDALAAGADDYLTKPFDRDVIQEKLAEIGVAV